MSVTNGGHKYNICDKNILRDLLAISGVESSVALFSFIAFIYGAAKLVLGHLLPEAEEKLELSDETINEVVFISQFLSYSSAIVVVVIFVGNLLEWFESFYLLPKDILLGVGLLFFITSISLQLWAAAWLSLKLYQEQIGDSKKSVWRVFSYWQSNISEKVPSLSD